MGDALPIDAALLRTRPLPAHDADASKNERGRVLVVGGGRRVPGAALLAGEAALRAGAGKLQIATAASLAVPLGLAVPEAMVLGLPETAGGEIADARELADRAGRVDAAVVGPGMLDEAAAGGIAADLADAGAAGLVVDAGALCRLGGHAARIARHGRLVLTPHAGEMAKLLGDDPETPPEVQAQRAAARFNAVVALKGGHTVIAAPDGRRWRYDDGRVGLATSGSGDTLAGLAAGLLARGAAPEDAAIWAVWLHGEAGNRLASRIGPVGFLARELLAEVPALLTLSH